MLDCTKNNTKCCSILWVRVFNDKKIQTKWQMNGLMHSCQLGVVEVSPTFRLEILTEGDISGDVERLLLLLLHRLRLRLRLRRLLLAPPFRGRHSTSSASISPYPLPPLLLHQPSPCPSSLQPWTFSAVFLFSSCLAAPSPTSFGQCIHYYCAGNKSVCLMCPCRFAPSVWMWGRMFLSTHWVRTSCSKSSPPSPENARRPPAFRADTVQWNPPPLLFGLGIVSCSTCELGKLSLQTHKHTCWQAGCTLK